MKPYIKAGKSANDFLTSAPVSELMDEIRAAITQDCPQGVRPPVPDPAGTDQCDVGDEELSDSRYVCSNLVTADQMQRDVDGKVQQYCDHCARIVDMWVTYVQEVDSYSVQGAAMKTRGYQNHWPMDTRHAFTCKMPPASRPQHHTSGVHVSGQTC